MKVESKSHSLEVERSQDRKLQIIHFGSAPAFFIPFSRFLGEDKLETLIEMHNNLSENTISFWRTFGINGYLTNHEEYQSLLRLSESYRLPVFFGLPLNNDSFAIKSELPGLVFYNLGSSATVAAYKGSGFLTPYSVTKISDGTNGGTPDSKGIVLQTETEEALLLALNNTSASESNYYRLKKAPLSLEDSKTLNPAFVLKIDVNDSTKRKITKGNWLEEEVSNSLFMSILLHYLEDQQTYSIDTIGESVIIICENSRSIPIIYQGLKDAIRSFSEVSIKAVGKRLPEITLYFTEDGTPFYYTPFIQEEAWRQLELIYKKQVEDGIRQRKGTFYIPRQ